MYKKTNSFLLCMDLQPYSQYCFSKLLRTLFDFLNSTYWVSLFQRNNSLIFWTGVSCVSVTLFYFTLFCCGGKANLVRLTLFYSTLLTLTDGMTDRGMNTIASRGQMEPFFQLCCCVSFFVLAGNRFWLFILLCTQSIIQLWCCVSFFWLWQAIVFGVMYILREQYSCAVVSFLLLWRKS